ncbi:MAG: hypothetical protein CL843_00390 [Crocinitomicaceae bacterium]|nr:hypothetical protein [Crocinitomicaceae bacterium]|tara:strand:+ start:16 stop:474 length:459 start_codon:yes stop_codon:yes gene_type:complete
MEEKEKKETFENPIDADKVAENPGLMEYAHTVGSAVIKPEDKGKVKGRAMAAMVQQTNKQLEQLYAQMKVLAEQAQEVKKRVEVSEQIYQAEMGFEPLVGHTYHLYQRKDNSFVLSMVEPSGWGKRIPFERYVASATLMADHTWDVSDAEES